MTDFCKGFLKEECWVKGLEVEGECRSFMIWPWTVTMQHSSKQLQKGWRGDTVEGYPEPALQQKTEEKRELLGNFTISDHWQSPCTTTTSRHWTHRARQTAHCRRVQHRRRWTCRWGPHRRPLCWLSAASWWACRRTAPWRTAPSGSRLSRSHASMWCNSRGRSPWRRPARPNTQPRSDSSWESAVHWRRSTLWPRKTGPLCHSP